MEFLKRRMDRVRLLWFPALLACLAAVSGCVTGGSGTSQYQDERTAVTVTVASNPVVLAREVPVLAANARDYVSLTALEVNRTGKRSYYLFGYSWSTIDRKNTAVGTEAAEAVLVLQADDRKLTLKMSPRELETAGLSRLPLPPPGPGARPILYPTDRPTLVYVGAARELSAELGGSTTGTPAEPFRPWNGSTTDFSPFLDRTAPVRADRSISR